MIAVKGGKYSSDYRETFINESNFGIKHPQRSW